MEITIRLEQNQDFADVEAITREAFWNIHVPGCAEHYLAHLIRKSDSFISELDYVAVCDNHIVGNIMYTKAKICCDNGNEYSVISFGPISVLPQFQGKGIGSKLIEYTKAKAEKLGFKAILIYGDPDYYCKFGFKPAQEYGVGTSWDTYAAALLACELEKGALNGCNGRFFEDEVYNIDAEKAEEFDKGFAPKEKLNGLPSQEKFAQMVAMNIPR